MPKLITKTVYTFDELSDSAKEKAREWYRTNALDYDWWDGVYQDAANMGLKITGFDMDHYCHGELTQSALQTVYDIIENHGDTCETYKTALEYKSKVEKVSGEEEEDLASEFLKALLEDYRIMLRKEYDYLNADEQVDESILANDYTFTENGKREG